jgi:tRNA(fMet)-specific endonuclease VapC
MKYLLDTNIISEMLKTSPNKSVINKLEQHRHGCITASPVWHELQFGCLRLPTSRKRKMMECFLKDILRKRMAILPYDTQAAQWHARERARLMFRGYTPSFVDGQIASIAKVNDLIIVTRNTFDFDSFSGLSVENWYKPE